MLTDEEISELINKNEPLVNELALEIIKRYIYDLKNIDVGKINLPTNLFQQSLLNIATSTAVSHYKNKT